MTSISRNTIPIRIVATPYHVGEREGNQVYAYSIHITNWSDQPVQLIRRHWDIHDLQAGVRLVEGEGVIGKKPVLQAGEHFEYDSWCPMRSEIGCMRGHYTFMALDTLEEFEIDIPEMVLIPDYLMN